MTDRSELTGAITAHTGASPLSEQEIEAILALAGAAAHGTGDRTSAPVATFLAGIAAAGADDRLAALDELRRLVGEIAPQG